MAEAGEGRWAAYVFSASAAIAWHTASNSGMPNHSFYPQLSTLFDYLPDATQLVVLHPPELDREARGELDRAQADHAAEIIDR